jgi:hypothetical protein
MDHSGRIEFANRVMPGTSVEGFLGREWFGYVVPEHRCHCYEAHQQAMLTGQVHTVESLDLYGNCWACPFARITGIGETDHVMAICRDITQNRKVELALGEREQRYRQLLAAVGSNGIHGRFSATKRISARSSSTRTAV